MWLEEMCEEEGRRHWGQLFRALWATRTLDFGLSAMGSTEGSEQRRDVILVRYLQALSIVGSGEILWGLRMERKRTQQPYSSSRKRLCVSHLPIKKLNSESANPVPR